MLDNTILTNFALVNRADWVIDVLGADAWTTTTVMAEYEAGANGGTLPAKAWRSLIVVELADEEAALARRLPPRLGAGERSCLALALNRQAIFASDDLHARRLAQQHGLPTTGILGLLVLGVQHHHFTLAEANAALAQMIALGFRSPVTTLDDLAAL